MQGHLIQTEQQFQPISRSQPVPAGVSTISNLVFTLLLLVVADPALELGLQGVGPSSGRVLEWGDLYRTWYGKRFLASLDQGTAQLIPFGSPGNQIKMRVPEWPYFTFRSSLNEKSIPPIAVSTSAFARMYFSRRWKLTIENEFSWPGITMDPGGTMLIAISSLSCVSR